MLTVDQALKYVLEHADSLPARTVLLFEALDHVLAEQAVSDIDSPPHDKSVVDGYAVVAESLTEAGAELSVLEEITAGALPSKTVEPGTATRIMTGAPLPPGATAAVMVEQTELLAGGSIRVLQADVREGQNIVRRAASLARGQVVLSPGTHLRAIEIGLLAEVGRHEVRVVPRPTVAIIATGNELVSTRSIPGPAQIRNSNGPLLTALTLQAGAQPTELGIARDEQNELAAKVSAGLSYDVLVLSGGVSAGVLDLVPQVLRDQGVEQVFHKVNLKPGKPLWFGIKRDASNRKQTLAFGLPGNPVSTLVCFELFVRPAIQKLRGLKPTGLARVTGQLAREHKQRGDRPTYWPAALGDGRDRFVTPLPWKGSGDLRTLTEANCLAFFPPGERVFSAGDEIQVLQLPS